MKAHDTNNPVTMAAQLADEFCKSGSCNCTGNFPTEKLRALAKAGLLAAALPDHLDGLGIGCQIHRQAALLPVLKEIGRGSLPLGRLFEGHVNALLLLQEFGSRPQITKVADDVLQRDAVLGIWNTGPPGSPKLTPVTDGEYRLSGLKTFATGAARIQQAIVTAALPDGGWQMCLVSLPNEAVLVRSESWSPLGMEASESFTVEFRDLKLMSQALIGKPGDYYAEPMFTAGALRFCAVQLGGAKALFDACVDLVKSSGREQDPFHLQRLGEMMVLLETGQHWLAEAGEWLKKSSREGGRLPARAQMMRIATEEICTRVVLLVQRTVGARNLAVSEPFARTLRDLQMYLRQAGFDEAYQAVGRSALQEPR